MAHIAQVYAPACEMVQVLKLDIVSRPGGPALTSL